MNGHSVPLLLCACFVLSLTAGSSAGGTPGVRRATVQPVDGMPVLTLDGHPTLPIVFFHNTDIPGDTGDEYLRRQVALARDAGVHIYSLPLRCPRLPDGVTPNYPHSDGLLDRFIAIDPEAKFILRVYPGPDWSWKAVREKTVAPDEYVRFADGSTGMLSIASEWFAQSANDELAQLVSRYEGSDYAGRIIAWHAGGPGHEMFMEDYRQSGPDYSEANQRGFRRWLTAHYDTVEALRKAWANADVSFEGAVIPPFDPGRFPMRGGAGGAPIDVFYDLPAEQSWVDFSAYMSDITADRIVEWARIIAESSRGRRLSAFFYGYTFDLPGSFCGHYALGRVLACPDVHILASPYSYHDRFAGGAGNFMTPVDSISAHGKLWFNEDDTRTSVLDTEGLPEHFALFDRTCADLQETLGVLQRNFGAIVAHRAGTWWMDLVSRGAFNHPEPWRVLKARGKLYAELYALPRAYCPEAAVIVDEKSKLYVKDDWDTNYWTMYHLRDAAAKTGVSVGYYTLEDFIAGVAPPCKAYVFANAFYLPTDRLQAIHDRLDKEGAPAVWVYAPGYLRADGADAEGVQKAVGMRVETTQGPMGSEGVGPLAGLSWGAPFSVSPRFVVVDDAAQTLGSYTDGAGVSCAQTRGDGHRSIFLGGMGPSSAVLRHLLGSAGCHVWTQGDEVVHTDGAFLMIHSGKGGRVTVRLPDGVRAHALDAEVTGQSGDALQVNMAPGETAWLTLEYSR